MLSESLALPAFPRYSFLSAGVGEAKTGRPFIYGDWIQCWSDGQSQHGHHAV